MRKIGPRIYCSEIPFHEGSEVELIGWIRSKRILGKIVFLVLRDSSGACQLVFKDKLAERIKKIRDESLIRVKGKVVRRKAPNPAMKTGHHEVLVNEFEVIAESQPLPIDIYNPNTSLAKRLDYRFLDLRNRRNFLIFKLRSEVLRTMRDWFYENDFIEINPSSITLEAPEGGAEVFPIVYFDKEAYLTQSPQLFKQYAIACGFEKVFITAPVWRAEPHFTTRHLCEFYGIDAEIAFIKDHRDIEKIIEDWLKYTIENLENNETIKELDIKLPAPVFERITVRDAHKLIKKEYGKEAEEELDISWEEEKLLGNYFWLKGIPFVFVEEYGWKHKPFYHMRKESDPSVTKGFDLLFLGLEIITGSQREHRYEKLLEQAKEKGVSIEKIDWYLEAFKYGMPPHGGFGFGLDRFMMQLVGTTNIREVVMFPRDPERVKP